MCGGCQVALKPVYEELDQKTPYGLLQSISVGIGDVISDLLQKTLDNVSSILTKMIHSKKGKTVNGTNSITECHLPYGITQCYPPPDTSEHNTS